MYPIFFISGNGLGVCQSSLEEIGPIVPAAPFGSAGIKVYVNLGTGNIVVFDRLLQIPEVNGPLNFQFIYNSHVPFRAPAIPKNAWRFGIKKFKDFPAPKLIQPPTFTLIEEDGHETTYTYQKKANAFFAPPHAGGTPYLYYSEISKKWVMYNVGTRIVEIYNVDGTLAQRIDQAGHETKYGYDRGELTHIYTSGNNCYDIRREFNAVIIYKRAGSNDGQMLQCYYFDSLGRLAKTLTRDDYAIEYTYVADTNKINQIRQSDGTLIQFDYDSVDLWNAKVKKVSVGKTRFEFLYDKYQQIVIKDTLGFKTAVTLIDCHFLQKNKIFRKLEATPCLCF